MEETNQSGIKEQDNCYQGVNVTTKSEGPVRSSLFSNVPPFLNYLPDGKSHDQCPEHTETMVDLRECLWRVPVAVANMVDGEERVR